MSNGAKELGLKFVTDILTRVTYPGEPMKPNDATSLHNAYHEPQHYFHTIRRKRLKVKSAT